MRLQKRISDDAVLSEATAGSDSDYMIQKFVGRCQFFRGIFLRKIIAKYSGGQSGFVGIVVGSATVVALVGLVILFVAKRRRSNASIHDKRQLKQFLLPKNVKPVLITGNCES
jgi:hypothetical protein